MQQRTQNPTASMSLPATMMAVSSLLASGTRPGGHGRARPGYATSELSPLKEVAGVTTLQEGQLTGAQRRQFVRDHRTAIFAYGRNNDGPAMSALYYVMDGDDLLISTMRARAKAKAVQRNPKVSLCILDENWPPTYLTVFCDAFIDATVDTDLDAIVDLALRVGALMAERKLDDSMREHATARVIQEDRVQLRLKPYASFMTPPRHVRNEGEFAKLTHWTSATIPWDAE
jgi:pyridoxamine 5'-phosphate oxidase-like protein